MWGRTGKLEQSYKGVKGRVVREPVTSLDRCTDEKVRKVTRNLRNPWVSVQDVVLNSLEPSTLSSQPLPELSHFYTHTHTSNRNKAKCLAHVAMVLVGVSRLDTKMMRSRQLTSFCQLHKSDHKNTCLHKKSLHQDMVCLFK